MGTSVKSDKCFKDDTDIKIADWQCRKYNSTVF